MGILRAAGFDAALRALLRARSARGRNAAPDD